MNATIKIEGMSCGHCSARVTKALEAANGVSAVSVSLENGSADVTFDDQITSVKELSGIIEDVGYTVAG